MKKPTKSVFDELAEYEIAKEQKRIAALPFNRLYRGYDSTAVMSEGHARAKEVLTILFFGGERFQRRLSDASKEYIEALDLLRIYGAQIAVFHDELCGGDVHKSRAVLRAWKMRWIQGEDVVASLSVSGEKRINPTEILARVQQAFPDWR